MSVPDLLVQTQQRVDKLLAQLRQERSQLEQTSKLDAAIIAEGIAAIDAVIAALVKTAAATDQAIQRKGSP
jgi:exopolyphosphatase/pppGpp-phosphohydrolase